ncbi:hypothetical protein EZV73_07990 [Acidaminobacter sp. JC074]|uniref:SGNH/GDSL hydrolase family protein n=1 Tax=Acidaminobacter sp. JC074 TaxID=2530199 RepID=UPI001F10C443|nr:SGNH/GDSL hydrolase family protein [Acidaminobacter sp. JC074]MCH4887508.1 hypothetical protein [Acidaminobacter sp. JC074]
MMTYLMDNVSLKGLVYKDGRLQRLNEEDRLKMTKETQDMLLMPAGNEIRFYMEKDTVEITLSSSQAMAVVYLGDFQESIHRVEGTYKIQINMPKYLDDLQDYDSSFHPRLVRIMLFGGIFNIEGISGSVRKPKHGEQPDKTLLFYGTSITHGKYALDPSLTYPKLTGRFLKQDVINLGLAGTALIEPEMAETIARLDYDSLVLCLSVNMFNLGYDEDEFFRRSKYLLDQVRIQKPHVDIYCISIIKSYYDHGIIKDNAWPVTSVEAYRRTLKTLAHQYDNVHYIDGTDLLSTSGLSSDLLHPGNMGMIEIAQNLSKIIGEKDENQN